eukprot:3545135-Lingulodinium_polyedra.AAC.1
MQFRLATRRPNPRQPEQTNEDTTPGKLAIIAPRCNTALRPSCKQERGTARAQNTHLLALAHNGPVVHCGDLRGAARDGVNQSFVLAGAPRKRNATSTTAPLANICATALA